MLGAGRLSEEERYKDCDRFKFKCPNPSCGREIIIDSVFTGAVSPCIIFTFFCGERFMNMVYKENCKLPLNLKSCV